MYKVLVVDDSAFIRKVVSDLYADDKDFVVVATARNGKEALEKIKIYQPDLITMDVEMPIMDGITALTHIMKENPTPVIMISSMTQEDADVTLLALELGAVDFVAKYGGPISDISRIKDEILEKSRIAVRVNAKNLAARSVAILPVLPLVNKASLVANKIVAIGTSTGGPKALQEIITRLPQNLPAGVVIVQHMPPGFTRTLANRLNTLSALTVKEAENDEQILSGYAYIAPGDYHMVLDENNSKRFIRLNQNPPIKGHRPSVDPLLDSVAALYGAQAVGVLLTGMGQDGAKGMFNIKKQGGYTIAEDQSTAVVFGMPKAAIELGGVDKVLPLSAIAAEIIYSVTHR